jgi:hypothetical protein
MFASAWSSTAGKVRPARQPPAVLDDAQVQLAVHRMGDVLLLHRRVHRHRAFLRRLAVELRTGRQQQLSARLPDALPEIHQVTRIARRPPLEILKPAQKLPVRVLHPASKHRLIPEIEHLLEQQQRDHQPHRLGRTPLRTVKLRKRLLETRPGHPLREQPQRMSRVELLAQRGHQKGGLSARKGRALHRAIRPAFPAKP